MLVVVFFSLWKSRALIEIVVISLYKHIWSPTTGHPILRANHLEERRNQRAWMWTKTGYVLVKAFILPSYDASWLTSLKKSSEVWISHIFLLFYSSATSVQWWLQVQKCAFCIVSMQFVFPFLVFFVLLLTGTFNTKPLLVLRRGCKDPDTRPEQRREQGNNSGLGKDSAWIRTRSLKIYIY